jgi:hypothetical protein
MPLRAPRPLLRALPDAPPLHRHLDSATLRRLLACPAAFRAQLTGALAACGMREPQAARALAAHDDWAALGGPRLPAACHLFRQLAFAPAAYLAMLAARPQLLAVRAQPLHARLHQLAHFFTRAQLHALLPTSPGLLLDDFDAFR